MLIKVLSIFGTRPEAIKMAPLVNAMKADSRFESCVCVTAQHRDMLDQVLEIFDIKPDFDLDIMKDRQSLTDITVNALLGLEKVIAGLQPDIILVHGDTTTTFIGSLAAFYNKIRVGHVEAGLRTFNKYFPYPEEMNRKLTGAIADIHFAPTSVSKANLLREGVPDGSIFVTGNTAIDALKTTVKKDFRFYTEELKKLNYDKKRIIMVTAHRRENLGEPLGNICRALKRIVQSHEDVEIVYAVHKNPAVRETVYGILGSIPEVHLLEPLDVDEMHNLMGKCYMVLTDSGGLQEEAPSLGKPVLVLRRETERPEAIEFGTLKLAGVKEEDIFRLADTLLTDGKEYCRMANAVNPYGDGHASERIIAALLYYLGVEDKRPGDFVPNNRQ
ncbi:MAG TPA: UDP-N-acetylglucosamine 2-epimerase (non-hydrolyzing) [Bacillota bacterium]|nr:UDP-N-acetylglucosamine 2-epimerase (non-hydrolyzing) [Bacillota bacterium]HNT04384.1 UDP-N-acetylglucosamine 2-epimerase (non-hydrolyzing) [Bacillota bacterium]